METNKRRVTRRDFIKFLSMGIMASSLPSITRQDLFNNIITPKLGRVTSYHWFVFEEPNVKSNYKYTLKHDQIIQIKSTVVVKDKTGNSQYWYKLAEDEYVLSTYIQLVENKRNVSNEPIPENGRLGEITVPKIEVYLEPRKLKTNKSFYYSSTFWVKNRVFDEYDVPWYELPDDVSGATYYVRAYAVRLVTPEEITPISPEIPLEQKRIVIDLKDERVTAFENNRMVFSTLVSTGLKEGSTPFGTFMTNRKRPYRRMVLQTGNKNVDYDLPGVPWVSYITLDGVALHGAYWHSNWGNKMSNGCINMRPEDAKWIYRWSDPNVPFSQQYIVEERGTRVDVVYGM